ncbi:hypothetical protein VNO77_03297 [Canavalia gladiata]|uniref:Uncharacterized protein n=1 Tax=Canavalia gladiata TaxID=3824 RepID=A0AAN9R806_CANGL
MNDRLKGLFPSLIISVTTLTHVDMASNQISTSLQNFTGLGSLEQLDLKENKLECSVPAKIFSLPNISYLNVASNEQETADGSIGNIDNNGFSSNFAKNALEDDTVAEDDVSSVVANLEQLNMQRDD